MPVFKENDTSEFSLASSRLIKRKNVISKTLCDNKKNQTTRFADVAGADEEKEESEEVTFSESILNLIMILNYRINSFYEEELKYRNEEIKSLYEEIKTMNLEIESLNTEKEKLSL